MNRDNLNRITLIIDVWVDTEDYSDVLENLDYEIKHPNIKDTEFVDADWA